MSKNNSEYSVAENSAINGFIEIAKTGKFAQGDLTTEVFDDIVSSFNPTVHEPPHTLGHIRANHNDKPAMAWVAGLKRVGDTLFAKSKQVSSALDGFVRDGAFKKRSIGVRFNDTGKAFLHHIAWLGSSVPAVKGLANVYAQEDFVYDDDLGETQKEFEFNQEKLLKKEKKMELSETELQAKIDAGVKVAGDKKDTEFKESLKTATEKASKDTKEKLEKEFKEKEEAGKKVVSYKGDVEAFLKEFAEGEKIRLVPAQVRPLRELLFSIGENKAIEYSEMDKDKNEKVVKTDTLKLFREVIQNFKEVPKGELPKTKEGPKGNEGAYEEEKAEAKKIQKEYSDNGGSIGYTEAVFEARRRLGTSKTKEHVDA